MRKHRRVRLPVWAHGDAGSGWLTLGSTLLNRHTRTTGITLRKWGAAGSHYLDAIRLSYHCQNICSFWPRTDTGSRRPCRGALSPWSSSDESLKESCLRDGARDPRPGARGSEPNNHRGVLSSAELGFYTCLHFKGTWFPVMELTVLYNPN